MPTQTWNPKVVLSSLIAVAAIGGAALLQHENTSVAQQPVTSQPVVSRVESTPQNTAAQAQANALSHVFRKAAEAVLPTVVTIETSSKPKVAHMPGRRRGGAAPGGAEANPFAGTPFEHFFNDPNFGGGQFDQGQGHPQPQRQGTGSGVIIDASGIILTNNHVVEGADEVLVRLHDGREFKATDIKTDPQTDLAVVRISDAGSLPAATLGDSDKMEIGDWVIAVGNPFGLDSTVSAGIISGKQRELRGEQRTRYIQTDAAINPGNSGGPLVNLDGEVVGINTAIATNSGGYQGVGFAIPSTLAKWITKQLIESGSVERAWLGVSIGQITPELASKFDVKFGEGVLVAEVHPESPAAAAGVHEGDVIVGYGGVKVRNPRDLQEVVERTPIDSKQTLDLLREGKPVKVEIVAKPLPSDMVSSEPDRSNGKSTPGQEHKDLGVTVSNITKDQAKALGYEGHEGVLITQVAADTPAGKAGLKEGMLILKVGKTPVSSVEEFDAAMQDQSIDDGILLLVRTDEGNRFVVIQNEK